MDMVDLTAYLEVTMGYLIEVCSPVGEVYLYTVDVFGSVWFRMRNDIA